MYKLVKALVSWWNKTPKTETVKTKVKKRYGLYMCYPDGHSIFVKSHRVAAQTLTYQYHKNITAYAIRKALKSKTQTIEIKGNNIVLTKNK